MYNSITNIKNTNEIFTKFNYVFTLFIYSKSVVNLKTSRSKDIAHRKLLRFEIKFHTTFKIPLHLFSIIYLLLL